MNPKTGEIIRKELFGEEMINEEKVARYDALKQILFFKNQDLLLKYKIGATTFLAAESKSIRSFQREDMKIDETGKNVPRRPAIDPNQGYKTPAVVEWMFRYEFNHFCARYGVFLGADKKPILYTGKVSYMAPVWRERPGDQEKEFCGQVRKEEFKTDVMVSVSKTHLTFIPEECLNWNPDDPQSYEQPDQGDETVGVRSEGKAAE